MTDETKKKIAKIREEINQLKAERKKRPMLSFDDFEEAVRWSRPFSERISQLYQKISELKKQDEATPEEAI